MIQHSLNQLLFLWGQSMRNTQIEQLGVNPVGAQFAHCWKAFSIQLEDLPKLLNLCDLCHRFFFFFLDQLTFDCEQFQND